MFELVWWLMMAICILGVAYNLAELIIAAVAGIIDEENGE